MNFLIKLTFPFTINKKKDKHDFKNNNGQFYIELLKIIWSQRIKYYAMYIITIRKGYMHAILYIQN
jgi:hypothetical protein